jgi:hypothetical protein
VDNEDLTLRALCGKFIILAITPFGFIFILAVALSLAGPEMILF